MDDFDFQGALTFLSGFHDVINMNVVDLYLDSTIIPSCWRHPALLALSEMDLVALASSVFDETFIPPPSLPEEITSFFLAVQRFSLVNILRYHNSDASTSKRYLNDRKSDKKKHEIERLGRLIDRSTSSERKRFAIDFGAGQGYLSQLLADAGWDVIALERDDGQCHGSLVRQKDGHREYKVLNCNIDAGTSKAALEALTRYAEYEDVCFCSLHACGSLSMDLLRLFIEDPTVRILANVGCCYNLMREEDCSPKSEAFQALNLDMGWMRAKSARMLACQAPWRWASRPVQSCQSFRSNHFRALFQAYILPHLETEAIELGHLPSLSSFSSYVKAACDRIGQPVPTVDLDGIEALHDIKDTAVIWTMRSLLGPVIESLLLADRFLWVRENIQGECQLLPLFDPVQSPRNFVLYAVRLK